ncbi:MAG: hypothetical protein AAGK78_01780 [Planctomycetota bacterium]
MSSEILSLNPESFNRNTGKVTRAHYRLENHRKPTSGRRRPTVNVVVGIFSCLSLFAVKGAVAESFVLSATQLDRVTAGSSTILADGESFANAVPIGLADTTTDVSVSATVGSVQTTGVAAGSEGAAVQGFTTVSGTIADTSLSANGFGAGDAVNGEPVVVTLGAEARFTSDEGVAASAGVASAPSGLVTLEVFAGQISPSGESAGSAYADSLSTNGTPASGLAAGEVSNGTDLTVAASGAADDLTVTGTAAAAVVTVRGVTLLTQGASEAGAAGEGAAADAMSLTRVGDGEGALFARAVVASTASSTGTAVLEPAAATAIDVLDAEAEAGISLMTNDATHAGANGMAAQSISTVVITDPAVTAAVDAGLSRLFSALGGLR